MPLASYPHLIPSYEHERLAALQPYRVLATPGQATFNDFVGVVAKLFNVPIALISLVREDDVVFVGSKGIPPATVTNRADSICSVAILNEGLTIFEDLEAQPCDLVNPFLAQQMRLGFYAGQALRAPGGMALGSLCVIDRRARQLTPAEEQLLKQLAVVAQDLLALQAAALTAGPPEPGLRARLDALLHQSLTRVQTLADLQALDYFADAIDIEHYNASRLDEGHYLAQALHRELAAQLK